MRTLILILVAVGFFSNMLSAQSTLATDKTKLDSLSFEIDFPFNYEKTFKIKVHTDSHSVVYYVRQANFIENPVPLDVMRYIEEKLQGRYLGDAFKNKIVTFEINKPSKYDKIE